MYNPPTSTMHDINNHSILSYQSIIDRPFLSLKNFISYYDDRKDCVFLSIFRIYGFSSRNLFILYSLDELYLVKPIFPLFYRYCYLSDIAYLVASRMLSLNFIPIMLFIHISYPTSGISNIAFLDFIIAWLPSKIVHLWTQRFFLSLALSFLSWLLPKKLSQLSSSLRLELIQ